VQFPCDEWCVSSDPLLNAALVMAQTLKDGSFSEDKVKHRVAELQSPDGMWESLWGYSSHMDQANEYYY
jgi:Zn/Cd-binding protein ZinT